MTMSAMLRMRMTIVVVSVSVRVIVVMIMVAMIMRVSVMLVGGLVMVDALRRAAAARILAEQQRLDRYRHGIGRHADATEIDVVEIA